MTQKKNENSSDINGLTPASTGPFRNLFKGFCDPRQASDMDTVTSKTLDGHNGNKFGSEAAPPEASIPTEIFKVKKDKTSKNSAKKEEPTEELPPKTEEQQPPEEPENVKSSASRNSRRMWALDIFFITVLTVAGTLFALQKSGYTMEVALKKVGDKLRQIDPLMKKSSIVIQPKANTAATAAVMASVIDSGYVELEDVSEDKVKEAAVDEKEEESKDDVQEEVEVDADIEEIDAEEEATDLDDPSEEILDQGDTGKEQEVKGTSSSTEL